jgi:hypothetical protein
LQHPVLGDCCFSSGVLDVKAAWIFWCLKCFATELQGIKPNEIKKGDSTPYLIAIVEKEDNKEFMRIRLNYYQGI